MFMTQKRSCVGVQSWTEGRHLREFGFPPGWRFEEVDNVISMKPWNEISPFPLVKGAGLCPLFPEVELEPLCLLRANWGKR